MSKEFITEKPAIFQRPGFEWLQYAETRRAIPESMIGNMSDDPRVLNLETYELMQPDVPYEVWLERQKAEVAQRVVAIESLYDVAKIGRPRPAHGVDLVRLDDSMHLVHGDIPAADRLFADATLLRTPGYASMFAPADCIVATVAYPQKALAQIHIGFRGGARNIVEKTLTTLEQEGLSASDALVYFSPHVQSGFPLNADEVAELTSIQSDNERVQHDLVAAHMTDDTVMDLTGLALDEFKQAGVKPENIQVSYQDTFTDPTLYSDFNKFDRGFTGRFGVIAGIKKT